MRAPRPLPRLLALLALALGACGDDGGAPLPANFQALPGAAAPALAPVCPDAAVDPQARATWIVFGDVGCRYCRDWLATLDQEQAALQAAGIQVIYSVADAADCAQARRSARHVPFPVALGTAAERDAFEVGPTPETAFVYGGRWVGRMLAATNPQGVRALAARLR